MKKGRQDLHARQKGSAVGAVPIWCFWSARKLSPARSTLLYPETPLPNVRSHRPAQSGAPWSIVVGVSADGTEKALSPELTLQASVSQVVVRTMKDLYGRGPTHAKTYIFDEYVFCVMSGGMTRDEETMIRGGQQEAVRDYRLRFQSVIAPELIRRVEDVLGQKIVSYHSQVLFDPDRLIEIFVLDPSDDPGARDRELPAPA